MKKKHHLILFVLLASECFSQIGVDWKSNIEFYSHNSSGYVSANPAIDFTLLNNNFFSITQNGNLSCINDYGEVLWKKKIISAKNSNIYSAVNIEVIDGKNILITKSNDIQKYSSSGSLIWETEIKFFKKKYFINSLLISQDNSIYLTANLRDKFSHPLAKSYLFKYDTNGKFIWKHLLSSKEEYSIHRPTKGITEVNQEIFVFGNANDPDNKRLTTIYKFNRRGKLVKSMEIKGYANSIQSKDNTLFILIGDNTFNTSYIKITSINKNLEILNEIYKELPFNGYDSKENYKVDTLKQKITEVFYTKIPAKIYDLEDFNVINDNTFVIAGGANKDSWITKLVNDSITTNWKMNYAYNTNIKRNSYYQSFNKIKFENGNYYISGICVSNNDNYDDWIKLFLFKVDFSDDD